MNLFRVKRFDGKKPDILDHAAGALLLGVFSVTLGPPLAILYLLAPNRQRSRNQEIAKRNQLMALQKRPYGNGLLG